MMQIKRIEKSKLESIDLNTVTFGSDFTDHMLVCDYVEGKWQEPQIVPYAPISISPSAQVFHYGQAVFEGMKAYKDNSGDVFLFRPDKNFERINKSAKRLAMPQLPKEIFMEGLNTLVDLDKAWIPAKQGKSLYIRPVIFATEEVLFARPSLKYKFMIICSVAGAYYSEPLNVMIADQYSRSAEGGVGFAKAAGNYAASFHPTLLAKEKGYDQIIWTDAATHTKLEEAGTMNLFFRIGDQLVTPKLSEKILHGVTRDSVIQIAKDFGYAIEQRDITVEELKSAQKDGSLKEAFGCGTAVVVNPIKLIGYPDGENLEIVQREDSWSSKIKNRLTDIQYNKVEDSFGWRFKV